MQVECLSRNFHWNLTFVIYGRKLSQNFNQKRFLVKNFVNIWIFSQFTCPGIKNSWKLNFHNLSRLSKCTKSFKIQWNALKQMKFLILRFKSQKSSYHCHKFIPKAVCDCHFVCIGGEISQISPQSMAHLIRLIFKF